MHFNLILLIKSLGYLGVWSAIFAESGIIFCFFFPGDSLLFTAGFLASQNIFSIITLCIGCFIAAVAGNMVGYALGKHVGLKLFAKGDTRFLKRKHFEMTQNFYERHGVMAVIMARFMPIIRTFVPFLAGVVQMRYRTFIMFTVIGAAIWVFGMGLFGYFFGRLLPADQVDKYLLPIIVAIMVISTLPSLWHIWKEHRAAKASSNV